MARRLIIRLIATSGNEAKDPNKSLLSGIISGVARAARELVKAACLAAQYTGKKILSGASTGYRHLLTGC